MNGLFQYECFGATLKKSGLAEGHIDDLQKEVKESVLARDSSIDQTVPVQEYMGMIAARRMYAEIAIYERLGIVANEA